MEYHVLVERDPETGDYAATVLELPEIVAGAATEQEAVRLAREAITFTWEEDPGLEHRQAKVFTIQVA